MIVESNNNIIDQLINKKKIKKLMDCVTPSTEGT